MKTIKLYLDNHNLIFSKSIVCKIIISLLIFINLIGVTLGLTDYYDIITSPESAKLISDLVAFVWLFVVGYQNNDITVEGKLGTQLTRELKTNRHKAIVTDDEPKDVEV